MTLKIGDKVKHDNHIYTIIQFPFEHYTSWDERDRTKVQIESSFGFRSTVYQDEVEPCL